MADRLESLRALESMLWESLNVCPEDKRAPLAAQYRATLAEIAAIESESGKAGDPVDEIAARRAARGGATSRLGRASGGPG